MFCQKNILLDEFWKKYKKWQEKKLYFVNVNLADIH